MLEAGEKNTLFAKKPDKKKTEVVVPEKPLFDEFLNAEKIERVIILYALNKSKFNKTTAAAYLNMTIKTLYNKIHYFGWPLNNVPKLEKNQIKDMCEVMYLINKISKEV